MEREAVWPWENRLFSKPRRMYIVNCGAGFSTKELRFPGAVFVLTSFYSLYSEFILIPVCGEMNLAVTINSGARHQIHEEARGDVELFALVDDVEHCLGGVFSAVCVAKGTEKSITLHVCVDIVDNQGACGVAADVGVWEVAAELID